VKQVIHDEGSRPIRLWTEQIEDAALQQLRNLASLPFIDRHGVLSFVYVDNPLCSTQPFRTHLFQYSPLFSRLPRPFHLWFASSVPGKFPEAERVFRTVVTSDGPALDPELLEYFDLRRRWEAKKCIGPATRARH